MDPRHCLLKNGTGVKAMSRTWELMVACIEEAARAEDLFSELAFRRDLRLDTAKALSTFELRAKPER
ncbi:MAG: hypothetical protein ABI466_01465 [Chloroflexota bacterium]